MARLLVVEDEPHLAMGLRFNLEADGHDVEVAGDGETALARLGTEARPCDAVLLDVMLPGKNGFEVARELRARGDYVPILMLTARGRPEDVLQGFDAGVDDYLPKPFELPILLARVRSLLRRSTWARSLPALQERAPEVYSFGGNSFDPSTLELRVGTMPYHLTAMEADLLQYLLQNAGKVVTRKAILEDVWGLHEDTDTRAIDNFIVRLRRFLNEDPSKPRHVITVRGRGYRFIAEPHDPGRTEAPGAAPRSTS
jgi:DNA-binding response OmpR family regulator